MRRFYIIAYMLIVVGTIAVVRVPPSSAAQEMKQHPASSEHRETKTEDREAAAKKPNVILFLVDDMGWADLACYGSDFYETPSINRLVSEGVRFTDAYATCHVCSPSRASILTGKYPARLDLTDWLAGRRELPYQRLKNAPIHQALPLEEITLAESLRRHG